jgi:hypothetical protein
MSIIFLKTLFEIVVVFFKENIIIHLLLHKYKKYIF